MMMIEKVVRALSHSYSMYPDESDWLTSAKAAIEAMREPSKEMIAEFDRSPTLKKAAVDSYQAMIDAALKE